MSFLLPAAHALKGHSSLTKLRLARCGINGSDLMHLKTILKESKTLTDLDLSDNRGLGSRRSKELGKMWYIHYVPVSG